jgi:ABC-type Fe3+/spermidine/putrescine transport system ATPase subunit
MNKGTIEQEGTPLEIFDHPATPFVAEFVGENNFIEAEVSEPHLVRWGGFRFGVNGHPTGKQMRIYFRPNDVYVSSVPGDSYVPARITKTRFKGPFMELELKTPGDTLVVAHVPKGVTQASRFGEGSEVYVGITSYHAFADDERIHQEGTE